MFRTIKAKYPGSCKRCGGSIYPGDSIRYGGPGRLYHFAAACGRHGGSFDSAEDSHPGRDRGHIGDVDSLQEAQDAAVTAEYGR